MIKENALHPMIDRYANQVREDFNVPGLAVAIVKDDALVYAQGYGERKLGEPQPFTANTLFGIASISKSFTALALGLLVDEGKLKWNDPVSNYLPVFQLDDAFATREITVLDLLVHRTGLAEVSGGTVWYGTDYDRSEVIHRIRYLKPVSSFRSTFSYQNIMYLVAGQIIPVLTGQSWDEFVSERIFRPLGMVRSNTSINDFGVDSDVIQPHAMVDGELAVIELRNYDNVGPAASINSTVVELAAYARLFLNGGHYEGKQLYSPAIAHDLWSPHILRPLSQEYPPEYSALMPQFHSAYALGWNIQDYHGQRKVSHAGGIDGLRSLLTMIPEQNLGVIVFANDEGMTPWVLTNIILDLYQGNAEKNWYAAAQSEWHKRLEKQIQGFEYPQLPNTRPSLDLEKYANCYLSELYGEIEVKLSEGQLHLHFCHTSSFSARLSHWHLDTFRIHWHDPVMVDGFLTFVLDSLGQVQELRLDQPKLLDVDFSELHPIKRLFD